MVGLLFNRELASKLDQAECLVPDRKNIHEARRIVAFATNDERMLKALKLIGFKTISKEKVQGIETFCKLLT
jgi:hypothetical protein